MLKIAEMPYNGANSIFLRLLIDKKYALPFRVVDALVFHFLAQCWGMEERFPTAPCSQDLALEA